MCVCVCVCVCVRACVSLLRKLTPHQLIALLLRLYLLYFAVSKGKQLQLSSGCVDSHPSLGWLGNSVVIHSLEFTF